MLKMQLPNNSEKSSRNYKLTSTNVQGVETYAPPSETVRFISDLNKLEFMSRHADRDMHRAQLGAITIDHLVLSMMEFDGNNQTFQGQFKKAVDDKFGGKPFHQEALSYFWGGVGEYTAYRLFEQLNKHSEFGFNFEKADVDEDLSGIDAWVTPDDQLGEYEDNNGQRKRLGLSIKHIANLPDEINDLIYPLRDMHDMDAIVDSLGTDLQSFSSSAYSRDDLLNSRLSLRNAVDKSFWRFQGYVPDYKSEGGWVKALPTINEAYGDEVIPAILLTSRNRKRDGEPLVDVDQVYTLEAQLADNPDKWS